MMGTLHLCLIFHSSSFFLTLSLYVFIVFSFHSNLFYQSQSSKPQSSCMGLICRCPSSFSSSWCWPAQYTLLTFSPLLVQCSHTISTFLFSRLCVTNEVTSISTVSFLSLFSLVAWRHLLKWSTSSVVILLHFSVSGHSSTFNYATKYIFINFLGNVFILQWTNVIDHEWLTDWLTDWLAGWLTN